MMRKTPTEFPLVHHARQMRNADTPAEKAAWIMLHDRRMLGLKFRRQVPIDRYIVDFYCHELRLIVELDGPVQDGPEQAVEDEIKNDRLEKLGFQVLRVKNEIVMNDPEAFTEMIRACRPSPAAPPIGARHPLPEGEGFA